jgi:hypothetical protein
VTPISSVDTGAEQLLGSNMGDLWSLSIEFPDGVAKQGDTTVVETNTAPATPPYYRVLTSSSGSAFFYLHTTAVPNVPNGGQPRIKICIHFDPSQVQSGQDPTKVVTLQHDDGVTTCKGLFGISTPWCQVPATVASNIICGEVSSLSPFAVMVPAFDPPTVSVPAPIVVEASGPLGTPVTYTATATDVADGTVVPACTPASGSTFPVGTTTVTCTASDRVGLASQASFTVTVQDTRGPVPGPVPSPIVAYATSPAGAKVSYAQPTATDAVDGPRPMDCAPASGSTFEPGKTSVTCTASDTHGNTSSTTFTVWVQYQAPGDGTFFLQPINADGSSIFKQGSTIPVKFKLLGASAGITSLPAHVLVAKVSSSVTGTYVEAVSTANGDSGNTFRYDPSSGQYIFNLSTKSMTTGTWSLRADLGDGVDHSIAFSLR